MATKQDIKNQQDLNALQRLTISMSKDLEKSIKETSNLSDKRNKSLSKSADLTKNILKNLQQTGDIDKAIARTNTIIAQTTKQNFGVNEKLKGTLIAQQKAILGIVEGQKQAGIVIQGVFDTADQVNTQFKNIFSNVDGFIQKIPLIGPALSNAFKPIKEVGEKAIERATVGIKNGFIRQFTRAKESGLSFTQSLGKGLEGGLSGANKAISGTLGITGDSVKTAGNAIKDGFTSNFKNAKSEGLSFTKSLSQGLKGGLKSAETAISGTLGIATGSLRSMAIVAGGVLAIVGSIVLVGYAIYKVYKLGLERFKEIDAAAKSFRSETGLLISQTGQLSSQISEISSSFAGLGISAEDVSKAASSFVNEFDGIEQASKATLTNLSVLSANMGVSVDDAVKLNKVFQNIGGLTQEQSQALVSQTAEMAKMAGVAPQKVIKDMADSAGEAYRFFGGNPQALAKAAVEAAALGTSIQQAADVANSLLDYENSVNKELEASAILGTNLNLSRARQLAASNDILGAQQEIVNQTSQLGDLTKLNVYEQQALVDATGMEFESLVNQQRIRERFGSLDKERLAAATKLLDTGKDIADISASDLDNMSQQMARQQEMQSQTERLKNAFGGISTSLTNAFSPMAEFVIPIIADVGELLGKILIPLFNGIGQIITFLLKPVKAIWDIFMAIVYPIVEIGKVIMDGLFAPIRAINTALAPVFTKFSELKGATTGALDPLLNGLKSVFDLFGKVAGFVAGVFAKVIMTGLGGIFSVLKNLGTYFGGIIDIIKGIFTLDFSLIGKGFSQAFEGIKSIFKGLFKYIFQIPITFIKSFSNVGSNLSPIFSKIGTILIKVFTAIPIFLVNGMIKAFSTISGIFSKLGSFIVENISKVFPNLGKMFGNLFSTIGSYFTGLKDLFVGIFTLDFGKIGGSLKTIFTSLFSVIKNNILFIPTMLWKGLTSIFPNLSTIGTQIWEGIKNIPNMLIEGILSIGGKIKNFFMGLLPSWAQGLLGGGKSDVAGVQEQKQLEVVGSIGDGIVQNGKIITTDPADTITATKNPSSLLDGFIQNSPMSMLAGGISNLASGISQPTNDGTNMQLINKLDELKQAFMSNKDVYMDKEKVSRNVAKTNEKSKDNVFGLGVA